MALVCLCRNVSERKVVRAIARGADSVDAIGSLCGAGTCCHGCHATIEQLLADAPDSYVHAPRTAIA